MNNKSKLHQNNKTEKENANIKLQKNVKRLPTDKHLINKKETVWDRLSKIKKTSSTENVSEVAKSPPHFTAKTSQHFQSIKQPLLKQSLPPSRKRLTLTHNAIKKRPKVVIQKPDMVGELSKQTFLHDLTFEETITSRSSSEDSKYSPYPEVEFFEFPKPHNELLCYNDLKPNEFSEGSTEEYTLAPLLTAYPQNNCNSGPLGKIREFSQCNCEDIELWRDGMKSDSGNENLDPNRKLLKDILKKQLENMSMQEFVVKKDLEKLESSASLRESLGKESTVFPNKIIEYSGHKKEIQKFEVDVVFKNVPSLRKEIEILRALGEKLETTLKSTTSHRTTQDAMSQISTATHKIKYESYVLTAEKNVQRSEQIIGIRQCVGVVYEFCMAQKSICELKRESSRPFYVPSNRENVHLIQTSFKKLKDTPKELLRLVKPKNSQTVFNILEQDPVFFYCAFSNGLNISSLLSNNYHPNDESQQSIKKQFFSSGNTNIKILNTSNQEMAPNYSNCLVDKNEYEIMTSDNSKSKTEFDTVDKPFKTPPLSEAVIRGKNRRPIKRLVTPMPIGYFHCPKSSLIKTILVGFAQMSVFIVFIMALTYPSVRCLNTPIFNP